MFGRRPDAIPSECPVSFIQRRREDFNSALFPESFVMGRQDWSQKMCVALLTEESERRRGMLKLLMRKTSERR